ncbi:MAG: ribonuclease HII [Bacteriovoracales bacterium]|nr:ribonuclease HII [Bacteriovoracales bacterium]
MAFPYEDLDWVGKGDRFLVGLDEVGRGPLAGPVVACGLYLDLAKREAFEKQIQHLGVGDSKKLSPAKRAKIVTSLGLETPSLKPNTLISVERVLSLTLCEVDHETIDRINIKEASLLAMARCLGSLAPRFQGAQGSILVDGPTPLPPSKVPPKSRQIPLVKGDSRSALIGLASIVAKEYRDHLMRAMGKRYPNLGFESHFGYPTKAHKKAIQTQGPTPIHRQSFRGVREWVAKP